MGIGALQNTILVGCTAFGVILASILYLIHRTKKTERIILALTKRIQAVDITTTRIETLFQLDAKTDSKRKALENPSVDLKEFLSDLKETGVGMIRIDPDSVFLRGIRN